MTLATWSKIAFALFVFVVASRTALPMQSTRFDAVVELSDGTELEAQLDSIDESTVKFVTGGEEKLIPTDEVSQIRFAAESDSPDVETGIQIALIDGSKLRYKNANVVGRDLVGLTQDGTDVKVSTRLVDYAIFASDADPELQKEWTKVAGLDRESDALVVNRDQKLQMVDGVIGDISDKAVTFTVGERTAEVKRARLTGILFYRRIKDELPPANFVLKLADGSRIQSRLLAVKDETALVTSRSGAKFEIGADAITTIDLREGRSVSLTDLDPASNDWEPLLTSSTLQSKLKQFSLARMDQSFSGKRLSLLVDDQSGTLTRREFPKGFAIQGGGKLSFLLAKQYRQLTGTIGFDPDANSTGVVKLVIQIDGKNRVEEVLDASKMETPFAIDVDLIDASRIVFKVDYHDRRNVGDILHAVELKLHR
jgi:hypothetical protein